MSIKMKLVSCISAFILVLGIFIFGVLSAEQATVNLGGSISFDATDVYARVTGKVQNAQTNPTLETLEFSAYNDTPDQSSWSGLDLRFDSRATDIIISVTVENLSMERSLTVNVTDALATPVDNLGKTILLDGASYVSGMNKTIPVATAADASNTSKVTFTITLDVLDHNKSLPSTTFDYDINLMDESTIPETYQPFEFEVIEGTENEVRITSHSGSGDVVIPATFSLDTTTPVTSFIVQDFNGTDLSLSQMVSLYLGEFYYTEEGEERSKTNMLEFSNLLQSESLTFPITFEPTYRYEFDGYSETNAMLLMYAIMMPSDVGYTDSINYYLTNDEFTRRAFTAEEFINYIMENYPEAFSDPTTLKPLFSTTGSTILETDPIASGAIIDGTDYIVKEIGEGVFYERTSLNSITIPDSVTSIGDRVFSGCSNLTSVDFGDNSQLTGIGNNAFYDCSNLTSVDFGDNSQLTGIGNNAFYDCSSLSSVNFGDNSQLTGIGNNAFRYCSSLTSITIPETVTSIGQYAFQSCSSLSSVNFGDNRQLTSIGNYIFSGCSNLTSVDFGDNSQLTGIGNNAFYDCSSLTSITIPETVTSIGQYAFSGCSSLSSVNFGDNSQLTGIGNNAFYDCTSLTSITIPSSVTSIGEYAFRYCSSLESVSFKDNSQLTTINSTVFPGCSSLFSVNFGNNSQLKSIGSSAFEGCSSLSSVNFGENSKLTSIDRSAFYGCSSLSSVNFGKNSQLTSIGDRAFYDCSSLTSITIPETVTSIGEYAFFNCSSLTSITIPEGVTSIDSFTFSECYALAEVYNYSSLTITAGSLGNAGYLGRYAKVVYNLNTGDSKPKTRIIVVDNVQYYNDGEDFIALAPSVSRRALTEVTLDNQTTEINQFAFDGCSNLTSITIPERVTSIGGRAFYGCSSLTSITIPEGVTSIGGRAFEDCRALAEVYNYSSLTIPQGTSDSGVGYLGQYAKVVYNLNTGDSKPKTRIKDNNGVRYYDDGGNTVVALYPLSRDITTVSLDSRTTEIQPGAFYDCSSLTSITIPDSVTSIGDSAFDGCSNLTSITIPERVTSIGNYAFSGCDNLAMVNFGENSQLTSIGDGAFYGCRNLTSVNFGENSNLTSIGDYAFWNCGLTSITIPEGVTSIGESAFQDCSDLESITIPEGVTSIGNYAFSNCSFITVTIDSSYAYQNAGASYNTCGYLLQYADTVYVNANLVDDTSLTASSYLTSNFTRSETAENGYYVYTRNQ